MVVNEQYNVNKVIQSIAIEWWGVR